MYIFLRGIVPAKYQTLQVLVDFFQTFWLGWRMYCFELCKMIIWPCFCDAWRIGIILIQTAPRLLGVMILHLVPFLRRILFFAHNDSDELIATKIHLRNSHFVKKTYIYIYIYIFFYLFIFFHRWQLLQISDVATTTSHNATDVTVIHVHLFRLTSQAFCKCWYMKRWNKA